MGCSITNICSYFKIHISQHFHNGDDGKKTRDTLESSLTLGFSKESVSSWLGGRQGEMRMQSPWLWPSPEPETWVPSGHLLVSIAVGDPWSSKRSIKSKQIANPALENRREYKVKHQFPHTDFLVVSEEGSLVWSFNSRKVVQVKSNKTTKMIHWVSIFKIASQAFGNATVRSSLLTEPRFGNLESWVLDWLILSKKALRWTWASAKVP